jgi:hypothetical protein
MYVCIVKRCSSFLSSFPHCIYPFFNWVVVGNTIAYEGENKQRQRQRQHQQPPTHKDTQSPFSYWFLSK